MLNSVEHLILCICIVLLFICVLVLQFSGGLFGACVCWMRYCGFDGDFGVFRILMLGEFGLGCILVAFGCFWCWWFGGCLRVLSLLAWFMLVSWFSAWCRLL